MGLGQFIKSLYLSKPGASGQRRMIATAAYDIAGSPHALFTIAGGNIMITLLYAETTAIEAAGSTGQITFDPTGVGADIDWDDGTLNYNAQIGEITLIPMDVVFPATQGVAIACPAWPYNYICPPGVIEFTVAAFDMTGSIEWYLFYIPLDPEVTVV